MHFAVQPGMHEFLTAFMQRCAQTSWHDFFCANTGADADIVVNPNSSRIGSTFEIVSHRYVVSLPRRVWLLSSPSASRADLAHRGQWRRVGAWLEEALALVR